MGKVIHDIKESDYYYKLNEYTFYFSSMFNRDRFITRFSKFVKEENNKLKVKYHVNIDLTSYLLIVFYKKIEKRGFKVLTYKNNDIIELKEDYIFKIGE